jgi:hypothetical protein
MFNKQISTNSKVGFIAEPVQLYPEEKHNLSNKFQITQPSSSERKGRFLIQEIDDEKKTKKANIFHQEKSQKRTKHASINSNKVFHLLHNQSENLNLNSDFSTFILEDKTKKWVDFNKIWSFFSKDHCDVSECTMEKIFNYTDLKYEEDDCSYFNDSFHLDQYQDHQYKNSSNHNFDKNRGRSRDKDININNNNYIDKDCDKIRSYNGKINENELIISNHNVNITTENNEKINLNLNSQTTHDASHDFNLVNYANNCNNNNNYFINKVNNEICASMCLAGNTNNNNQNYKNNTNNNFINNNDYYTYNINNIKNFNFNFNNSTHGFVNNNDRDNCDNYNNMINNNKQMDIDIKEIISDKNLPKISCKEELNFDLNLNLNNNQESKNKNNSFDDIANKDYNNQNYKNNYDIDHNNNNKTIENSLNEIDNYYNKNDKTNKDKNNTTNNDLLKNQLNFNNSETNKDDCNFKSENNINYNYNILSNTICNNNNIILEESKETKEIRTCSPGRKNLEINFREYERNILVSPQFSPINSVQLNDNKNNENFNKFQKNSYKNLYQYNKSNIKLKLKLKSPNKIFSLEDYFNNENHPRQKRIFSENFDFYNTNKTHKITKEIQMEILSVDFNEKKNSQKKIYKKKIKKNLNFNKKWKKLNLKEKNLRLLLKENLKFLKKNLKENLEENSVEKKIYVEKFVNFFWVKKSQSKKREISFNKENEYIEDKGEEL